MATNAAMLHGDIQLTLPRDVMTTECFLDLFSLVSNDFIVQSVGQASNSKS